MYCCKIVALSALCAVMMSGSLEATSQGTSDGFFAPEALLGDQFARPAKRAKVADSHDQFSGHASLQAVSSSSRTSVSMEEMLSDAQMMQRFLDVMRTCFAAAREQNTQKPQQ
ncbi:MAG: hypothetical protein ACK5O7_06320 [Holosporales bacterium]